MERNTISLKVVFFGATNFSYELAEYLLNNGINIIHFFTIPKEFPISYSKTNVINSNFADIKLLGDKYKIPCVEVESVKGKSMNDQLSLLESLNPDIILVMGWYYMVPQKIRNTAKHGAWGIHASLLPKYAGGAPLVWAMINGEKSTGVSLFKLSDGVDDGDIIIQKEITIEYDDTINEVYDKVILVSKEILLKAINSIDTIVPIAQNKNMIEVFPQRSPDDGEIDFSKSSFEIYNFIRAQSSPYPGAFFRTSDGKKIVIEKARIKD
jgi:methionyl-tRNA formyltransferase